MQMNVRVLEKILISFLKKINAGINKIKRLLNFINTENRENIIIFWKILFLILLDSFLEKKKSKNK
jgi:hypothetical protein